ncbi:S-layer homology domain-containing protein [Inediibacterium massiliense]|uniref:S-layer homology domain-containing protein n=1 Tax=Inediibacterium massiliense TaxID=1658111 RepID=UPI0006B45430|nr:S-layer homology domain-containing protein [Inediibacterium massiliense]
MKKIIASFIAVCMIIVPISVWAQLPGFSGGVNNEYEYEEMVFITGEPMKFTGTVEVKENEKDTEKTTTYTFKLKTPNGDKLDRKVDLETIYDKRNDKGQTIGQTTLKSFKESIKIGKNKYELLKDGGYELSKSDIIDNRPASDFYSGNLKARKYYTFNKDEGEVIVEMTGGNVGYKNFWGGTETQILDYTITSTKKANEKDKEEEDSTWSATVKAQVSDSLSKTLKYSANEASFSSFNGGHIRVTNEEMVTRYEYDLPRVKDDKIDNKRRNIGTVELKKEMVPKLERLVIPKFRDIGGHWAQGSINKLYSLDVFDENSSFFKPDVSFTRGEFVKAVMKACNIRPTIQEEKKTKKRNAPKEKSVFQDIDIKDPIYPYVKDAVDKGLIQGISKDLFGSKEPLTKAEAITVLIKALGFDSKAPAPGFYTSFTDDREIPMWAKDSIYMAREINLVGGDSLNRINPNKPITRAEASVMLVRFLEFLQKDLQKDYRENIINFH